MKTPPESTTARPFELDHQWAVDRFNDAMTAMRIIKEVVDQRRSELHAAAARFYEANRDLPKPE